MTKSSSSVGCTDSFSGGALLELAVSGESCLSKCVNIFWMTAGSVMHAFIFTFVFLHASQTVISILKTRFNLCAGNRMTTTYCGHGMVYLNLSNAQLNEDYSCRVVKQSLRLVH